ncbi:MAG TPA: hypothetical protein VLT84_00040, partial [Acidobacteriota bacterium]|nr:hypothetical protein [Acidobacteriota bacterium]
MKAMAVIPAKDAAGTIEEEHGQVAPQIPAVVRDAPAAAGSLLTILLGVARDVWLALFDRDDRGE